MGIDSQQFLVSVVTPVYNGEKHLADCIESVLAQTHENLEYIIVNNCSTDRTLEIAQHYARQDNRIRVYSNEEFLTIFQNWNRAISQISADSKYCKVVHADDWLLPNCITEMVRIAEMNPSVSIVGAYRLLNRPTGVEVGCNGLPYNKTIVSGQELCRWALLGELHLFGTPTTLLIRSSIIQGRKKFYNELNQHGDGDIEVCYDILQNTDFGFAHQILTVTRMHDTSVTSLHTSRLNTILPGRITLLAKYGPIYLSNEEYKRRMKEMMSQYYKLLGYNIFHLRNKKYWDYHKKTLENLGYPLSWVKLAKASTLRIIEALLNPKQTFEKVIARISPPGGIKLGLHS